MHLKVRGQGEKKNTHWSGGWQYPRLSAEGREPQWMIVSGVQGGVAGTISGSASEPWPRRLEV